MQRRSRLALVLPLVFATPCAAQTTAEMSFPTARYGPPKEAPIIAPRPARPGPSYSLPEAAAPASPENGPRYITSSDMGQGTTMGLGSFRTRSLTQPFSTQARDPASGRIAAVGVAVKF
jgi:hypothetical protein